MHGRSTCRGTFFLEAVDKLYKRNELATGGFVALGQRIDLATVKSPMFLLAARDDELVAPPQLFAAEHLVGTPACYLRKAVPPCRHAGLFMSKRTSNGTTSHRANRCKFSYEFDLSQYRQVWGVYKNKVPRKKELPIGVNAMNDTTIDFGQAEEAILTCEVSSRPRLARTRRGTTRLPLVRACLSAQANRTNRLILTSRVDAVAHEAPLSAAFRRVFGAPAWASTWRWKSSRDLVTASEARRSEPQSVVP